MTQRGFPTTTTSIPFSKRTLRFFNVRSVSLQDQLEAFLTRFQFEDLESAIKLKENPEDPGCQRRESVLRPCGLFFFEKEWGKAVNGLKAVFVGTSKFQLILCYRFGCFVSLLGALVALKTFFCHDSGCVSVAWASFFDFLTSCTQELSKILPKETCWRWLNHGVHIFLDHKDCRFCST